MGDQFGTKPEKFTKLLEQYVDAPEAGSGDELQRRIDDHIPAEFLFKPNLISMYVGGTVLATCPMLYAMLGAQLMDTGTSRGVPTRDHYEEHLRVAKEHYKRLRDVGHLMDEDERKSVTTQSTHATASTKSSSKA